MTKIILFASGSGSNVENIVEYFKQKNKKIDFFVFTNNPNAFVLERATRLNIPSYIFSRQEMQNGTLLEKVQNIHPNLIVLAGFLWIFPSDIITAYPDSIINIHPALLPKYGGKGMYGKYVHEAVALNRETETGISIHYVNEHYDEGTLIFQAKTEVLPSDNAEEIARKVHALEYKHFPEVIETLLR